MERTIELVNGTVIEIHEKDIIQSEYDSVDVIDSSGRRIYMIPKHFIKSTTGFTYSFVNHLKML